VNNVNIPKRSYHHGNLRQALVTSGMRALAEHGIDGISLRDVARRAGVTPPAVYRHFQDKDQLVDAIAAECMDRLYATIEEEVAKASDNPLARFRHSGIAYVQFAVAHPEHFRVIGIPGLRARLSSEQRAQLDERDRLQRADIQAGQAAEMIADIPIDELLLAANALVHGLAHRIISGELGDVSPARATRLAIAATGALGVGFIPREKPVQDPMRPEMKRKR
jgi:AcrR family transcriptional regulator